MSSKNPSNSLDDSVLPSRRTGFTVGINDGGRRVSTVLARLLPHQTLGRLQKAIREGDIRLDGQKISPQTRLSAGATLEIWSPLVDPDTPKSSPAQPPSDFKNWIIDQTADLLVLNKPSGILVHAGDRHDQRPSQPSLDDWAKMWLNEATEASLSFRPGPLHRLDRPTSGLVVFSASLRGAQVFSSWLAEGRVQKSYLAVMEGVWSGVLVRDDPLERDATQRITRAGGERPARTSFTPLGNRRGFTLALVNLEGGRTHQIRAHAALSGHPLVGDLKYHAESCLDGPISWYLHAWKLVFPDLTLGKLGYEAPLPANWTSQPLLCDLISQNLP